MAPSIIGNDVIRGEVFLPGQIFVFGGFVLRANSLGHLEQIESYAPGHQVRFGNLNYAADIRGDLIFDGFEPMSGAPRRHDEHDIALPPDSALEAAPASASTLNSEPTAPIEDGWLDTTSGATIQTALSRTPAPHSARLMTPRSWTPLRTPNPSCPCQSNAIGRQSWSSLSRTSFSTRLSATS